MNKVFPLVAIAALATGCASTTMTPAEHHQAGKTQYYDSLNHRHQGEIIEASAETKAEFERASSKEFAWQ